MASRMAAANTGSGTVRAMAVPRQLFVEEQDCTLVGPHPAGDGGYLASTAMLPSTPHDAVNCQSER